MENIFQLSSHRNARGSLGELGKAGNNSPVKGEFQRRVSFSPVVLVYSVAV